MNQPLDYLAVRKCSCAAGWASGTNPPRELAKFVGAMIRHGMDIRRVTTAEARAATYICPHTSDAATVQLALLEATQ